MKAGEGNNRGWDDWMSSLTHWTWVWASSENWWWTGKPDVLQSMGSQRVRQNWVNKLSNVEYSVLSHLCQYFVYNFLLSFFTSHCNGCAEVFHSEINLFFPNHKKVESTERLNWTEWWMMMVCLSYVLVCNPYIFFTEMSSQVICSNIFLLGRFPNIGFQNIFCFIFIEIYSWYESLIRRMLINISFQFWPYKQLINIF